jgi:transcriptional regulator with XRE-family HTH domain
MGYARVRHHGGVSERTESEPPASPSPGGDPTPHDPSLGSFLRSRRERLRPADVGLPDTGRRRTPGLRREELAMLAGVSVDYLVRLEQGRDTSPSGAVLAALAHALQLDPVEHTHLLLLSKLGPSAALCPATVAPAPVRPATRRLLDHLHPAPAFVLGPFTEVLAWNDAYERLVGPLGVLDHDEPNLIRFTFLDPRARDAYPEWAEIAREQVATLRGSIGPWSGQELATFVGELSMASQDFARLWAEHDVTAKAHGRKRFLHPDAGVVAVDFESMALPDPGDRRLVTYLASDAASSAALERIVHGSRPDSATRQRLRVVEG